MNCSMVVWNWCSHPEGTPPAGTAGITIPPCWTARSRWFWYLQFLRIPLQTVALVKKYLRKAYLELLLQDWAPTQPGKTVSDPKQVPEIGSCWLLTLLSGQHFKHELLPPPDCVADLQWRTWWMLVNPCLPKWHLPASPGKQIVKSKLVQKTKWFKQPRRGKEVCKGQVILPLEVLNLFHKADDQWVGGSLLSPKA